ncbi:histidine utilization repressor [Rhodoplanes roseus]|uniref:Histidine utilization repressor n=1 Tax=Rhodoplanes roseus TaxID=29409 RepID=A0A327KHQ4_9BRAD|nr:histidine utilization repressor [Rhodoplanes roseus]RAI38230.1 histidine utilization repressor [Rhodoplanes roseus]
MSRDDRMKPEPVPDRSLHRRIRADLEERILSGAWSPGHRIPFEHELMTQYGCARMTVNRVLSGLVEAGLIERRRRAGSFVRRPVGQSAVLRIPDVKGEVLGRGETYRYELLSATRRKATRADHARIAVAVGAPVLALACRHFADERPHAYEDRLIALDSVPEAASADFAAELPGTWLLAHVPWHEAEHEITAAPADAKTAARLDVPAGTACLVIERRTWRSGAPITAVRLWYPGDRQKLVARFTPSTAAGPGR